MNKYIRERWIDISKGILIILVVMGHSIPGPYYDLDNGIDFVYLFHMPAFFILAGYLYKPISENENIIKAILKRSKRILIPYIVYLILLSIPEIVLMIVNNVDKNTIGIYVLNMVRGGKYINYPNGALWFLTCLLFTEIIFMIIDKYLKKIEFKVIIIFILYSIAHLEAWFKPHNYMFLAVDISLMTIAYFSIGALGKKYIINKNTAFISTLIVISFLFLKKNGVINYGLELWPNYYIDYYLDLIIPIGFSLCLFNFIAYIQEKKRLNILSELGKVTLPIMCLHNLINYYLLNYFFSYGIVMFTIIGVTIPYILARKLFVKNKMIKKIFM